MDRECNEHYSIMAHDDYIDMFKNMKANILYAECLFQPGYQLHLHKLGKLTNDKHFEIPYPFTNQIVVADL